MREGNYLTLTDVQTSLRRKGRQENALLLGWASRSSPAGAACVSHPSASFCRVSWAVFCGTSFFTVFICKWLEEEKENQTNNLSNVSPTPVVDRQKCEWKPTCSERLVHGCHLSFYPYVILCTLCAFLLLKAPLFVTQLRSRLAHPQKDEDSETTAQSVLIWWPKQLCAGPRLSEVGGNGNVDISLNNKNYNWLPKCHELTFTEIIPRLYIWNIISN